MDIHQFFKAKRERGGRHEYYGGYSADGDAPEGGTYSLGGPLM